MTILKNTILKLRNHFKSLLDRPTGISLPLFWKCKQQRINEDYRAVKTLLTWNTAPERLLGAQGSVLAGRDYVPPATNGDVPVTKSRAGQSPQPLSAACVGPHRTTSSQNSPAHIFCQFFPVPWPSLQTLKKQVHAQLSRVGSVFASFPPLTGLSGEWGRETVVSSFPQCSTFRERHWRELGRMRGNGVLRNLRECLRTFSLQHYSEMECFLFVVWVKYKTCINSWLKRENN